MLWFYGKFPRMIMRTFRVGVLSLFLMSSVQTVYAEYIYFKTTDGVAFSCDSDRLNENLGEECFLRSKMNWQRKATKNKASHKPELESKSLDEDDDMPEAAFQVHSQSIEDGMTPQTPFIVDAEGEMIKRYVLNFMRYPEGDSRFRPLRIKNECHQDTVLNIARDLGFDKLEAHLCKILKIPTFKQQQEAALRKKEAEQKLGPVLAAVGTFVEKGGRTFMMGSPESEPNRNANNEHLHPVTLTPYEVMDGAFTQKAYALLMHKNPSKFQERKYCPKSYEVLIFEGKEVHVCGDHGVDNVSYYDAIEARDKLNEEAKDLDYEYDLPTEARQKDYFRGTVQTAFISGDTAAGEDTYIFHSGNSIGPSGDRHTHPVKSKKPNGGIYRSGLWEWGKDWYQANLGTAPVTDPTGPAAPADGQYRVMNGGPSWDGFAVYGRLADRGGEVPGTRGPRHGFRFVRTRKP